MKPFLLLGPVLVLLSACGPSALSVGADPAPPDGGATGGSAGAAGSPGTAGSAGAAGSPGTAGSGGAAGARACARSADCEAGSVCGFPGADACSAQGSCYAVSPVSCQAYSPGCACDGTEINVACTGLPEGIDTSPLAHPGPCSVGAGGAGGAGGGPCQGDADCAPDFHCGFGPDPSCAGKGVCLPRTKGALCNSFLPGCGCDGTTISIACVGFPDGYAARPYTHPGACGGGGGSSGGACAKTSDCGANSVCGFPRADACAAKGTCVAANGGAACQAYSPGCACDGTEVNLICNGLAADQSTKPLAHPGTCAGH